MPAEIPDGRLARIIPILNAVSAHAILLPGQTRANWDRQLLVLSQAQLKIVPEEAHRFAKVLLPALAVMDLPGCRGLHVRIQVVQLLQHL